MALQPKSRLLGDVGSAVATTRRARGLTQVQLSEKVGIEVRNLQRIEAGQQNLTLLSVEKIAKSLGVLPGALLGASPPMPMPWLEADEDQEPPERVPMVSLRAAAGLLKDPRSVEVEGWALVKGAGKHAFITRVDGSSMEPLIPSGSWCLFRAAPSDLSGAPVMLVEQRGKGAPDDGGSYFVKRVMLSSTEEGKPALRLLSMAKGYDAMLLPFDDPSRVRIVAAFDRVLQAPPKKKATAKKKSS